MQPTPVRLGVMDSARPGTVVTLPVHPLNAGERAWRGLKRFLLVAVIGVALVPVPLLHACGAVVAVVVSPIAGFFAWRATALVGASTVPCAKCAQPLAVPDRLAGWPARVHCVQCGAMNELKPEPAA